MTLMDSMATKYVYLVELEDNVNNSYWWRDGRAYNTVAEAADVIMKEQFNTDKDLQWRQANPDEVYVYEVSDEVGGTKLYHETYDDHANGWDFHRLFRDERGMPRTIPELRQYMINGGVVCLYWFDRGPGGVTIRRLTENCYNQIKNEDHETIENFIRFCSCADEGVNSPGCVPRTFFESANAELCAEVHKMYPKLKVLGSASALDPKSASPFVHCMTDGDRLTEDQIDALCDDWHGFFQWPQAPIENAAAQAAPTPAEVSA